MDHPDALVLVHFTHECIVKAEGCAQKAEDEVLSRLTALDHNLWRNTEVIQCVLEAHV